MNFHSTTFTAIGCSNDVVVDDPRALACATEIAQRELTALDHACSRFRDDSELAQLNAHGRGSVSPLLFDAVQTALDAAAATGGLVDPTVGRSLRALGYDRDFDLVVSREPRPSFRLVPASGWRSVVVEGRSVALRPGTELDLGATAKALAADRIAVAAHRETAAAVLVSLGGDIAVAGDPPAGGWSVFVTDDHRRRAGQQGQTVAITSGGLATSSVTVRRWRAGIVELHHIVDPRTGAPAADVWRTVTVAAGTCVAANVAATAAIVLGTSAPSWLEARQLSARLVAREGATVVTAGWPARDLAGCA
jgi:FAD:protein FMN transferase